MEPNPTKKKKSHAVFFTTLAVITVAVAVGIGYFAVNESPNSLLADIGTAVPQSSQNSAAEASGTASGLAIVNTIPTSTVSTTISSSSLSISPLALPYALDASTANLQYWPKAWGNISFTNNSLLLIPDPSYHGANGFLQGASSWSNYEISTNVSPLMGGWFDILARATNNNQNFVYCEFGSNGTEAIERVNGVDTQLAHVSASTTGNTSGATENFGMAVYGNEIGCTMAGQEVIGVTVSDNNESPKGGIGFVIFGAPPGQKDVKVSNVSVSKLSDNIITVPFPAPVQPTPTPVVAPPVPTPTPAPTPTPTSSTPAPESTTPATTTKTLPYSADTYYTGDGWGQYWGTFSEAADGLTIGSNASIPSGGALLDGTAQLDNYTFSATFDWLEGEEVGLFARHTDNDNYVECKIDRIDSADVRMSLVQDVHGRYFTLNQTVLPDYIDVFGKTFTASVEVQDTAATCNFDGHVLSLAGTGLTINPPYSGEVGITTWDPGQNNSRIVVTSDSINENY